MARNYLMTTPSYIPTAGPQVCDYFCTGKAIQSISPRQVPNKKVSDHPYVRIPISIYLQRIDEIRQYGPEQAMQKALIRQSEEQWKKAHLTPSANPSAPQMQIGQLQQINKSNAKDDLVVQQVRLAANRGFHASKQPVLIDA